MDKDNVDKKTAYVEKQIKRNKKDVVWIPIKLRTFFTCIFSE
jgi:hypothetical protein